jgi:hypothetical protein
VNQAVEKSSPNIDSLEGNSFKVTLYDNYVEKTPLRQDGREVAASYLAAKRIGLETELRISNGKTKLRQVRVNNNETKTKLTKQDIFWHHLVAMMCMASKGVAIADYKADAIAVATNGHNEAVGIVPFDFGQAVTLPDLANIESILRAVERVTDADLLRLAPVVHDCMNNPEKIKTLLKTIDELHGKSLNQLQIVKLRSLLNQMFYALPKELFSQEAPISEADRKLWETVRLAFLDLNKQFRQQTNAYLWQENNQLFSALKRFFTREPKVPAPILRREEYTLLRNRQLKSLFQAIGEEPAAIKTTGTAELEEVLDLLAQSVGFADRNCEAIQCSQTQLPISFDSNDISAQILLKIHDALKSKQKEKEIIAGKLDPEDYIFELLNQLINTWVTELNTDLDKWRAAIVAEGSKISESDQNELFLEADDIRQFLTESKNISSPLLRLRKILQTFSEVAKIKTRYLEGPLQKYYQTWLDSSQIKLDLG